MILSAIFEDSALQRYPDAESRTDQQIIEAYLPNRAAQRMTSQLSPEDQAKLIQANVARVDRLDNVERIGLDLFESHPLGLELAGVILLISLVGAVVIAKRQVEPQP